MDRALRDPETSEDLIDMIAFVEHARTQGMVKLNERITQSKDRLAYLIDVFLFTPEDIALNCDVLTWPKNINPVFDQNEEVRFTFYCYINVY
jgi:dynein heavy chain